MADYIRREEVERHFCDNVPLSVFMARSISKALVSLNRICEEIELIPTADVRENVHGEWEIECKPDGTPYCLHCSVCDQEWAKIGITSYYDFCPYCGADMRGDTNG